MVKMDYIELKTEARNEIIDMTSEIERIVETSGLVNGQVLVFVPGSTGGISTVEYEPGLIKDLPDFFESIIPQNKTYCHNETWGDGNGHSHVRATLIGPSLMVPVEKGRMILGTWQQIVFIEFDNKSRRRKIVVQVMGEN